MQIQMQCHGARGCKEESQIQGKDNLEHSTENKMGKQKEQNSALLLQTSNLRPFFPAEKHKLNSKAETSL